MALHTLGQWSTSNNDGLKKDIIAGSLTGQKSEREFNFMALSNAEKCVFDINRN